MNEIILDQIAIWTPKATNGFSESFSPIGTPYKEKGSNIFKKAEESISRYAKNYYLGGEPVGTKVEAPSEPEQIESEIKTTGEVKEPETLEASDEAVEAIEKNEIEEETGVEEVVEEKSVETEVQTVAQAGPEKLKFCLFVRTFRNANEAEQKLDKIAKEITESQILAVIGRTQTQGFNSFDYTQFNLKEID